MSISLEKKLGSGSYANVFLGTRKADPSRPVAIKLSKSQSCNKSLLKEDTILRYLQRGAPESVNIVKRINVGLYGERVCLELELMGMDLDEYYQTQKNGISLEETALLTDQLAGVLLFLEEARVVHNDIKPKNILRSLDGRNFKLADFGLASFQEDAHQQDMGLVQSLSYRSPEVVLEINSVTPASDMWSLGVLIGEVYSGKVLYFGGENEQEECLILVHRVRLERSYPDELVQTGSSCGKRKFEKSAGRKGCMRALSKLIMDESVVKGVSPEKAGQLTDLLFKMFAYKPEERATAKQVLRHSFSQLDTTVEVPTLATPHSSIPSTGKRLQKRFDLEDLSIRI
jgi:serine/threonine protein kinase